MNKQTWEKLSLEEQIKWWNANAPDETAQFKTDIYFRKYVDDKPYFFDTYFNKWKEAWRFNTLRDWESSESFVCEKPNSKSNIPTQESDLMLEAVKVFIGVWPYKDDTHLYIFYNGEFLTGYEGAKAKLVCTREQFEEFVESLFDNAPKDATHYSPKHNHCHQSWWKINDDGCFIICEKRDILEWLETPAWSGLELIPRPAKKAEQAPYIPKVGEECEFSSVGHHSGFMWCIFRGVMSDSSFIVEYHRNTSQDRVTCDAFNSLTTVFRPIITERDTRAVELYRMFHNDGLQDREIMQSDKFDTYLSMWDTLVRIQRGDV